MNPIGITFADDKFLPVAEEQQRNFNSFGLEHHIIKINNGSYDINLWLELMDATIDAVKKYGKILKVDAEVRIEKELPGCWSKADNVFFFIEPVITKPYYIALNTGQIILDNSALEFLRYQKTLTESLIPPNYTGQLDFDDEDMTAPAIKLSNVEYLKEIIQYDRSDDCLARATRGYWKTEHTVLTHPFFHNWDTRNHNIPSKMFFRNHFAPNESTKIVDAVILGLFAKTESTGYWQSLGFKRKDHFWEKDGWYVQPKLGSYWHDEFDTKRFIW